MQSASDQPLTSQLSDPNPESRLYAVKKIGMNYNPKYIPDLLKIIGDSDSRVREAVIQSLGVIGEVDPIVDPIIATLNDKEMNVKLAAIKVLGELGTIKAIKPLVKLIEHQESNIRSAIAIALGQIEDKQALVYLVDMLKDSEISVRINALVALGKLGDPGAIDPIIEMLSVPELQCLAIITLQKFKDPKIIPPLTNLLSSTNSKVRQYAILTLGSLRDPSTVETMLKLSYDEDPDIRRAATAALSEIKDDTTLDHFILSLTDFNVDVRETSARALGKFRDNKALKPLIDTLTDKIDSVRVEAATALGEICDRSAIKGLVKLLKDNSPLVRSCAVRSIGKIESQFETVQKFTFSAITYKPIEKLLNDDDKSVRPIAAEALARINLTHLKIDKAILYYKIASKESFVWDFHQDFYSACVLGCKIIDQFKKDQYKENQTLFPKLFELLKAAAKTGGRTSFLSEDFWNMFEVFNKLFLSMEKEEFIRLAQDSSLKMMVLNKKCPEQLRKILEKPEEALNQKFQVVHKRGLDLNQSLLEVQSSKEEIIRLGIQLLILEPIDISSDESSESDSNTISTIKTVLSSQIGINGSSSSQNDLLKFATGSSSLNQSMQQQNYVINEIEIGKNFSKRDITQVALLQILKGSKRTSLIEENRDVITRCIDRYYDLDLFKKQNILQLKKDAIDFAIKSKIIGYLDDAIYEGANICIFPEYIMPKSYIEKLQEFSNRYNLIIISGMEHVEVGDQYQNRACICCPDEKTVYLQKNFPNILPNSEKYRNQWTENIEKIIPPSIPIIKSPIGKFTLLMGQDIAENRQYLAYLTDKYKLDFLIFQTFTWVSEQSLQKYQNLADELKKPIFYVNVGQFGGTTTFEPGNKPDYQEILLENIEKIQWFSL